MKHPARVAVASVMVLALLATGVAVYASVEPGEAYTLIPAPPRTAWDHVDDTIGDDGVYSLQGALWAFVLAFEPLPGVEAPPGEAELTPRSGTVVLQALVEHWGELSGDQREVVAKYLALPPEAVVVTVPEGGSGPGRSKRQVSSTSTTTTTVPPGRSQNLQKLFLDAKAYLEGKTGLTLPNPTIVLSPLSPADAQAWAGSFDAPLDAGSFVRFRSNQSMPVGTGPVANCYIGLAKNLWTRIPTTPTPMVDYDIRDTAAHELFHCFQQRYVGARSAADAPGVPAWITEGSAEFAGVSYTGRADNVAAARYPTYLLTPTRALVKRSYDAFPFFFQLLQHDNDPWPVFKALWDALASDKDDANAFNILTAKSDEARATLAAGHFRHTDWGFDWDISAPGIPPAAVRPAVTKLTPAPNTTQNVTAKPFTLALRDIQKPAGKGIVIVAAEAKVHLHSGNYDDTTTSGRYCIGDSCKCPSGQEPTESATEVGAPLHLAVTGMASGSGVLITTSKLKCRKPPPELESPEAGSGGAGGGGESKETDDLGDLPPEVETGGSDGEPHLTTLDGHQLDFQAAGEFVAVDAGDGYTVQARQEMLEGSDTVSVNTAVAADVAGDVVQVNRPQAATTGNGRPPLRVLVDGEELDVTEDLVRSSLELPEGGSLAPTDPGNLHTGVRIAWPDGSRLYVWPVGTVGLHLMVAVGGDRAEEATGLLGPTDDGVLVARDGSPTVPALTPESDADFEGMYRDWGDSWRLDAEESLFTYASGESTDTFDRRDVPTEAFTLDDLDTGDRERAEEACESIAENGKHDECVFDTAVLGDDSVAASYQPVVETTTAVRATRGGNLGVGDHQGPVPLSEERKTYQLTLDEEQTVYLRALEDCVPPEEGSGQWSIEDPSGQQLDYQPLCADLGRFTLPVGTYTITWDAVGAKGAELSFAVLPVADDETFSIKVGQTVAKGKPKGAGTLDSWGQRHVFTFTAEAGDEIRILPKDCSKNADPATRFGLYAPGEDQETDYTTTSRCDSDDAYTVTLDQDGRWEVVVSLDATGVGHELDATRGTDELKGAYSFVIDRE